MCVDAIKSITRVTQRPDDRWCSVHYSFEFVDEAFVICQYNMHKILDQDIDVLITKTNRLMENHRLMYIYKYSQYCNQDKLSFVHYHNEQTNLLINFLRYIFFKITAIIWRKQCIIIQLSWNETLTGSLLLF